MGSVSWGAARCEGSVFSRCSGKDPALLPEWRTKTLGEKNCTKPLSPFFAAPVICFAPRLTERQEEAIVSVPVGLDWTGR